MTLKLNPCLMMENMYVPIVRGEKTVCGLMKKISINFRIFRKN